jgi:hypothetical protein
MVFAGMSFHGFSLACRIMAALGSVLSMPALNAWLQGTILRNFPKLWCLWTDASELRSHPEHWDTMMRCSNAHGLQTLLTVLQNVGADRVPIPPMVPFTNV